ncbi:MULTISPECIES: hypothetical protein [unclassified Pseudomonas]|uniref:hypothetical protein n=1 Tax=unclassified Pseudomonas TaxID=196821 RepID=UPI001473E9CB|nr:MULTISPECIES: hypothetical protein [unclassified Pseudomonas]NMX89964.1 hypothetical protein [Pseudomonas sp. WS 5086]NMY44232.1 hypothetical protein [Pseudomonas sp. WS 5027]
MRYLKATAQDISGNGRADTVILHFYQKHPDGPDELMDEMLAVDVSGNGEIDLQWTQDGSSTLDKHQLKTFAEAVLKLGWFNRAGYWTRSLNVFVAHYAKTTRPNAVTLAFHACDPATRRASMIYKAAAYDGDGDGVLESFTNSDVDHNGIANNADKELIRAIGTSFLSMNWHQA